MKDKRSIFAPKLVPKKATESKVEPIFEYVDVRHRPTKVIMKKIRGAYGHYIDCDDHSLIEIHPTRNKTDLLKWQTLMHEMLHSIEQPLYLLADMTENQREHIVETFSVNLAKYLEPFLGEFPGGKADSGDK